MQTRNLQVDKISTRNSKEQIHRSPELKIPEDAEISRCSGEGGEKGCENIQNISSGNLESSPGISSGIGRLSSGTSVLSSRTSGCSSIISTSISRLASGNSVGVSPGNPSGISSQICLDEPRPAAIHLLPSSKANTTVVNLINSPINTSNDPEMRGNIVSWVMPYASDSEGRASNRSDETTSSNPQSSSGRGVKRVGFCKTEIHFAADSGKVNIVETDGKPPPTNKFRRRRRNANKTSLPISNIDDSSKYETQPGKILQRVMENSNDDIEVEAQGVEEKKTDYNLQRGHTTTVNLGSLDVLSKSERNERGKFLSIFSFANLIFFFFD